MSSLAADASPDGPHGAGAPRLWQNLWVRLAVALAFADASIVVLALPQIVDRLHTTISHSTWVIMAYNLALIVTSALVATVGRRLPSTAMLVAGLIVFGLASLGCGASGSLGLLIALRCVQGVGGALVLAGSLPVFAGASRRGDSPLHGWSAAAAIGAAIGPAAGGVLTQLFDWRSIFLAQAPVAAVAAVAVMIVRREARREIAAEADRPPSEVDPVTANVALLLLSASLIGALFLVVIELINAWQLTPIGAAAVVSAIPLSTAASERLVRGRSAVALGATGAVLLAVGLVLLALATHRQIALAVIGLVLCGAGLGLAYPGLTAAALGAVARAPPARPDCGGPRSWPRGRTAHPHPGVRDATQLGDQQPGSGARGRGGGHRRSAVTGGEGPVDRSPADRAECRRDRRTCPMSIPSSRPRSPPRALPTARSWRS